VPVLGTDRGRASLVDAKLWAGRGTVLTADAVAKASSTPIVDPDGMKERGLAPRDSRRDARGAHFSL
jgi:hypothetical protein